jgi:hypothetical protein
MDIGGMGYLQGKILYMVCGYYAALIIIGEYKAGGKTRGNRFSGKRLLVNLH